MVGGSFAPPPPEKNDRSNQSNNNNGSGGEASPASGRGGSTGSRSRPSTYSERLAAGPYAAPKRRSRRGFGGGNRTSRMQQGPKGKVPLERIVDGGEAENGEVGLTRQSQSLPVLVPSSMTAPGDSAGWGLSSPSGLSPKAVFQGLGFQNHYCSDDSYYYPVWKTTSSMLSGLQDYYGNVSRSKALSYSSSALTSSRGEGEPKPLTPNLHNCATCRALNRGAADPKLPMLRLGDVSGGGARVQLGASEEYSEEYSEDDQRTATYTGGTHTTDVSGLGSASPMARRPEWSPEGGSEPPPMPKKPGHWRHLSDCDPMRTR